MIPCAGALPLFLSIHRRSCALDDDLHTPVDATIVELGDRHAGFEMAWRRSYFLAGRDAIIVAAAYGHGNALVSQRLVFTKNGAGLLVLAASVSGAFPAIHLDVLNRVASSLRFSDQVGAPGGRRFDG